MNELGYCLFSDKDEPFDEKSYEAKSGERTNQVNDFSRMNDIYSEIYEIIDDVFEDIDSHKKTELSESVISIFTKYKQQFAQLIPNTNYLNLYDYSNNNQNSISPSNINLLLYPSPNYSYPIPNYVMYPPNLWLPQTPVPPPFYFPVYYPIPYRPSTSFLPPFKFPQPPFNPFMITPPPNCKSRNRKRQKKNTKNKNQ